MSTTKFGDSGSSLGLEGQFTGWTGKVPPRTLPQSRLLPLAEARLLVPSLVCGYGPSQGLCLADLDP